VREAADRFVASLAEPEQELAPDHGEPVLAVPSARVESPGCSEVRSNLKNLGKRVGGAATVRWTVRAILLMLQLTTHLKRGACLATLLAQTVRLMLGEAGEALAAEVASGIVKLPTLDMFRHARQKLDLFNILFQRQLHIKWRYLRYVMFDASAQYGHEYFCIREDRIRFPRAETFDALATSSTGLQLAFETRI